MWYIDAASNMVIKFDAEGRTMEVLGMRPEPWTWATHVIEHAVPGQDGVLPADRRDLGADGNIFVSDGYGNSRVAKFDKEGNFVKSWGERGTGKGDFNTPHSIVIDKNQNLYVADRGNSRIQVFDTDGNFKAMSGPICPGPPWSFCITPGPNQVIYVGQRRQSLQTRSDRQSPRPVRPLRTHARNDGLGARGRLPGRENCVRDGRTGLASG